MPGSEKQNSMFKPSTGYVQKNNPFPVTSCGRRRNMGSPLHSNEPRKTTKGKGRNFRTVKEGAGMTEKGVENYKDKNPGSNLQTAVTEKNPSKKDKKRRDAFCARSRSWTSERGKAARRRWRC
jgi:hypothetical protein